MQNKMLQSGGNARRNRVGILAMCAIPAVAIGWINSDVRGAEVQATLAGTNVNAGISLSASILRNYYSSGYVGGPAASITSAPQGPGNGVAAASHTVSMPAHSGTTLNQVSNTVSNLGGFSLTIVPDAGLAANIPALQAFNRAAAQWAARISDPITITVNAGLGALGPSIIGSASSVTVAGGYNSIRDQMVADATGKPSRIVTTALPTAAGFTATIPAGTSLDGQVILTKANAKALGFAGLDGTFGVSDGTITFSNSFAFDFDNSDGVGGALVDFETVAAHEIGHLLGFFSSVDSLDGGAITISPGTLDLYRFRNLAGSKPTSLLNFTTTARSLNPALDEITADLVSELKMSTGVALGDGRQASHWKDDALTGNFIGLMDPTLSNGVIEVVEETDFRAMELMGYEVAPVPEPATLGLLVCTALFTLRRRRVG